jgi:hypothetical protein
VTQRASRDDLFAGGILVLLGGYFCLEALNYELGTPFRMGPGFLPLVLGGVLASLGLAVALQGLRKPHDASQEKPAWRAIVLIVFAIAFFGVAIRGLGFVPTVFVCTLLTAFASRMTTVVGATIIAAGLTLLSTLIFVIGLRLQVPIIGPWLGF